jgi:4-hydroxy-tetrahydrodipicolinate synthase
LISKQAPPSAGIFSAESAPVLQGVLSVFQTPFHEDESIDFGTLEKEIDWIFRHGADGLVMAMVSETLRLSFAERKELAATACNLAGRRGPVVVSVGTESARLSEELSRHAESIGAGGLMAIPPVSVALLEGELLQYYRRIAQATRLPLVVQDASGYVGRPLSISLQVRLLDEFGPRILFKPEAAPIGQRLSELREGSQGRARVFEGSGGIALVDSFRRGIVGTMPGAEIIEFIVALWKALEAGNEKLVNQLALPIGALVALQNGLDGYLAVEKYLLVKQGVFRNEIVRGPVGYRLDDETRREVDRLYALLQSALAGS